MNKLMGIQMWEDATENLKELFVDKYFGKNATDVDWVADDIGGVLCINDYFFDLSDIVEFLKYRYSPKKMFEYYDKRLKYQTKNIDTGAPFINIKSWKKLK